MSSAPLSIVPSPEVEGELVIPNEVIAQIVGLTVLECYGVVGMAARSLTQGVAGLLSRERIDQGVAVRLGYLARPPNPERRRFRWHACVRSAASAPNPAA